MKDKDKHIISLIENAPFASLSEAELLAIREHTNHCADCLRAFQAAQVSALLLKERAAEALEPSPFFQTRVMATLRERQATGSWANNPWALDRMWRAAGALASTMFATVAALAVLTFVIPGSQISSGPQQALSLSNNYSAEEILLNQGEQLDELSDAQVLNTIYDGEEEAVR